MGAHAALPLLVSAVKLHLPDFLLLERRKAGICSYTAASIGGKDAFSRFPPLGEEENWHPQLYRRSIQR